MTSVKSLENSSHWSHELEQCFILYIYLSIQIYEIQKRSGFVSWDLGILNCKSTGVKHFQKVICSCLPRSVLYD